MISVICPTYGRIALLEEAIQSFLNQNYLDKELIIVNDHEHITLKYNHPRVKIINLSTRFPSIGDKRNFCIQQSDGEMIVPLDDDDIMLPNYLDICHERLSKNYWWCGMNSFIFNRDEKKMKMSSALLPNTCVFRREVFQKIQFPSASFDENGVFLTNLFKKIKGVCSKLELKDIGYVCGFSPSLSASYHTQSMYRLNNEHFYSHIRTYVDTAQAKKNIVFGEIELSPHWEYDYIDSKNEFIKNNHHALDNNY